jgi:predicted ATPase
MPITKLLVSNFKGIAAYLELPIRPITLFIGANSSGKSTAIHAMACLAQTIKLADSSRPLVLDDDFAQVHLGRFIEVIHTHSYSDPITIGIEIGGAPRNYSLGKDEPVIKKGEIITSMYRFTCTKRTQEIRLNKAKLMVGTRIFEFNQSNKGHGLYKVTSGGKDLEITAMRSSGFTFGMRPGGTGAFDNYLASLGIQDSVEETLRKTLYLGPFRQSPRRRYPSRGGNPIEVGAEGESAFTILANESIQSRNRPNSKRISKWLDVLSVAKKIDVSRVGTSDLFDVSVTLADSTSLPIADLGYGISQIIPVLVQCSFAPPNSTLLFEQPELHLHPGAAKNLIKVFIETAQEKNCHIVAETHSRELMLQLLEEIRQEHILPADVAVYSVSRVDGQSEFKEIEIEHEESFTEAVERWDKGLG